MRGGLATCASCRGAGACAAARAARGGGGELKAWQGTAAAAAACAALRRCTGRIACATLPSIAITTISLTLRHGPLPLAAATASAAPQLHAKHLDCLVRARSTAYRRSSPSPWCAACPQRPAPALADPRRRLPQSAQQSQGIQTLLEAEKEAAKIVAKARTCESPLCLLPPLGSALPVRCTARLCLDDQLAEQVLPLSRYLRALCICYSAPRRFAARGAARAEACASLQRRC
jgi:hypothetical protein